MISDYNFRYAGLMKDAMQSIPIGNGNLGANIWADGEGLSLLLSNTDAWSELHRILKTGLLTLSLNPNPFSDETKWELVYDEGILYLHAEDAEIIIYSDANNPVYILKYCGQIPRSADLKITNYRSRENHLSSDDMSNYHMSISKDNKNYLDYENIESADIIFSKNNHSIGQYHHNSKSCYDFTLKAQYLEDFPLKNDPLLYRTFGFLAESDELTVSENSLSGTGLTEFTVKICSHTGIYKYPEKWIEKSYAVAEQIKIDTDAHKAFWKKEWEKCRIEITADKTEDKNKADRITTALISQRYMNICAGRGDFPIKFNGSIFTNQVSPHEKDKNYDYRAWGGPFWFQNTRLIYWSLIYTGDYELVKPFFKMYIDALPLAKYRTKIHFGHEGACFPETITFFGTYSNSNYMCDRTNKLPGYIPNQYIRYYFVSILELSYMMLEYINHTQDKQFMKEDFFPFVKEALLFYKYHFDVRNGKLFIHPTSALETWWECVDDAPTTSGLDAVTEAVLKLDDIPDDLRDICCEMRQIIPELTTGNKNGKNVILPFRMNIDLNRSNVENPELYAVFPFNRFGICKDNLELARDTFKQRDIKESHGWQQHGIQAARLGLTEEAEKEAFENSLNTNKNCIFPAFWGPNYDWLPDQDNGSNIILTVTNMLVQSFDDKILILPAWDKNLDVSFRLPIGKRNFVEADFKGGKLISLYLDHETDKPIILNGNEIEYKILKK